MRLRTDYKYVLIDEYTTYWNAFDNTAEFYTDVVSTDESVIKYAISKTKKVRGLDGLVSKTIYDQNSLWVMYYHDRKEALEAIDNIDESKVVEPLKTKRYQVSSKIVDTSKVKYL
jgi:hypothetical protein